MKTIIAFEKLSNLKDSFDKENPEMAFDFKIVDSNETTFNYWFREEVPGKGASKLSGVYLISDAEDNVLYIGKAGANNLGAEIWGKFRAPNEETKFVNSPMAKWAPTDELRKIIIEGKFLVSAAIIEPKEYASLAEVYLHIWCVNNGGLPKLNKRIG